MFEGADVLNIDTEPSNISDRSTVHDIHERRLLVSDHSQHGLDRYELHRGRPWLCLYGVSVVVLISSVRQRTLA